MFRRLTDPSGQTLVPPVRLLGPAPASALGEKRGVERTNSQQKCQIRLDSEPAVEITIISIYILRCIYHSSLAEQINPNKLNAPNLLQRIKRSGSGDPED